VSWWVALPVVLPLFTAAVLVVLSGRRAAQRALSTASSALLLGLTVFLLARVATNGIQVAAVRRLARTVRHQLRRRPPLGDHGRDHRCHGLRLAVYALRDIDTVRESLGYHPLFHVLLAGINGAFLTGTCSTCTSGSRCC
jgi:multicomponent Na+:H+ antiporter subunit D